MFQIVEFCNLCGRAAAAEVVQAGGELHRVEQRGAAARQDLRHHRRQGVLRGLAALQTRAPKVLISY